jgi:hypothetical protein
MDLLTVLELQGLEATEDLGDLPESSVSSSC